MSTHLHAVDAEAMSQACHDALLHLLLQPTDPDVTVIVDDVPHFVPGMGQSGEWYRVGALHLVSTDRYLTVYLDAVTGQVQVEQVMMEVGNRPPIMPSDHRMRWRGDSLAYSRWENEGGAS